MSRRSLHRRSLACRVRASLCCAVVFGGALACHDVRAIPLPPNAASPTVLLVVAGEGGALAARVIDGREPDWPPFASRADGRVYAVAFGCSPERLGLTPGVQALAEAPSPTVLTPPPASVFGAAVGSDASLEWIAHASAPPAVDLALRRLPLPADARCHAVAPRYTSQHVRLRRELERGPPWFAFALDDTRALVGSRLGVLLVVDSDGHVERAEALEHIRPLAGARAPDGATWLVDERGGAWRGSVDTGFTRTTTEAPFGPEPQYRIGVAASPAEPFELFAQTQRDETRRFFRFEGTRWSLLSSSEPPRTLRYVPAVSWVGPDEAVAIGGSDGRVEGVLRYHARAVSFEPIHGIGGAAGIVHHPTLGTLLGREEGGLTRREGAAWIPMTGALPLYFIRVLVPEGDGFMYGGAPELNFGPSSISHFQPSIGFCTTHEVLSDASVNFTARFGDGSLLLVTLAGSDSPLELHLLRKTRAAGSCSTVEGGS